MALGELNAGMFKEIGNDTSSIVNEMRDRATNVDNQVNQVGELWTDTEGQQFMHVWEDVRKELPVLFARVERVAVFMDGAYKAYMEFKEATARTVNVQN